MFSIDPNTRRIYDRYFSLQTETPDLFISGGVGEKGEWKYFKEKFPQCQFLGFEPHPIVRERVAPHFPGLLLPYALSNRSETVHMDLCEDTKLSSVLSPTRRGEPVQALTIETFFAPVLWEFQSIFVWLDIEGSELKALQGFTQEQQLSKVKWLNLEWRPRHYLTKEQSHWCSKSELQDYLVPNYREVVEYNKMTPEQGGHCDVLLERVK